VTDVLAGEACPKCAHALVSIGPAAPWCPDCEYGLGEPAHETGAVFGWGPLDRRAYRYAYRTIKSL
jgi:heat shock protein HtpX